MVIKRFRLSWSTIARVAAVGLLIGMGTLAVLHGRGGSKSEVAGGEAAEATDGSDEAPSSSETDEAKGDAPSAAGQPTKPSETGASAADDSSTPATATNASPVSRPPALPPAASAFRASSGSSGSTPSGATTGGGPAAAISSGLPASAAPPTIANSGGGAFPGAAPAANRPAALGSSGDASSGAGSAAAGSGPTRVPSLPAAAPPTARSPFGSSSSAPVSGGGDARGAVPASLVSESSAGVSGATASAPSLVGSERGLPGPESGTATGSPTPATPPSSQTPTAASLRAPSLGSGAGAAAPALTNSATAALGAAAGAALGASGNSTNEGPATAGSPGLGAGAAGGTFSRGTGAQPAAAPGLTASGTGTELPAARATPIGIQPEATAPGSTEGGGAVATPSLPRSAPQPPSSIGGLSSGSPTPSLPTSRLGTAPALPTSAGAGSAASGALAQGSSGVGAARETSAETPSSGGLSGEASSLGNAPPTGVAPSAWGTTPSAVTSDTSRLGGRGAVPRATPSGLSATEVSDSSRGVPGNNLTTPPVADSSAPQPTRRDDLSPATLPRREGMVGGAAASAIPGSSSGTTRVSSGGERASAVPGPPAIEGPQRPSIIVEKLAPTEAQVNQPAIFELVVSNTGGATAFDVVVMDRVPQGTRFADAKPAVDRQEGDLLIWQLGEIKSGAETRIRLEVIPERVGEIGSVAQVSFQAQASGRTVVTQPKLSLQLSGPQETQVSEGFEVKLRLRNEGDGIAKDVMIETDVVDALSHEAGKELRYVVGALGPGEIRDVTLQLTAMSAQSVEQRIVAHGIGADAVEQTLRMSIVAPDVKLEVAGPSLRFLERKAIHRLTVSNDGTATATNLDLVAVLPRGLRFVSADQEGSYDSRTHAVYWSLAELPAGEGGTVRMETIPIETGDFAIDYRVSGDRMTELVERQTLTVKQFAELVFEIDDEVDQVEVGSETLHRVRVENQGTKDANQVEIRIIYPAGLEPTDDVVSSLRFRRQPDGIVFETLERLAPGEGIDLEIRSVGRQPGDHRVAVEIRSSERPDWVRKEESTHVYADR